MRINVRRLKCKQCGYAWTPRKTEIFECPKCQSPKWNRPKVNKAK